uniref:Zingipain-2 n=1 Tax=Lygus hesperus TaxID=30085 RepID=A0A146M351_LYGHE
MNTDWYIGSSSSSSSDDGVVRLGGALQGELKDDDLPDHLDWVELGYLNPPRNQGSCGSCYAFATMGSIESRWGISKGKDQLKYLSPQMIIDCDNSNYGCSGGFMPLVYRFLITRRGGMACTDESYPYRAHRQRCHRTCDAGAKIVSYRQILDENERTIMRA